MAVTVDVVILRETEKAVLVMVQESQQEIWLPKSQIIESNSDAVEVADEVKSICITDFIAKEKGLN